MSKLHDAVEIDNLLYHDAVEFDNLLYHYKGPTKDLDFSKYNYAKSLFYMIKNKDIS